MRLVNHEITRRTMLSRSAGAAAFAAVVSGLEPLFAAPRQRWFKIGVCDWTLRRRDVSAFQLAKEIGGVEGLQISMIGTNDTDLRKPEMQKTYLEAAKNTGLEIASLNASGAGNLLVKGDPKATQLLDDSIDVCKALGLTISMSAFFPRSEGEKKAKEMGYIIGILKEVVPRAEKEGIIFSMENSYSAEDNMKVIDGVGSPAVKVYYDTGNSAYKGRDIYKEIRMLGDRICEFHAKDIELHGKKFIGRMLGQGKIDFNEVRKAIDDIQYSGWIQIEIEGVRPQKLIPGCRADYKYLRSIFPERQRTSTLRSRAGTLPSHQPPYRS